MGQVEYRGHGRKYVDSGTIILFSMEIAGTVANVISVGRCAEREERVDESNEGNSG